MNTKTTIPISEARKNIFKIANDVQEADKYYTLTARGRPRVVVLSAERFESIMETLEVVRDFPNLGKDIKKAKKEYCLGRARSLEDILAERSPTSLKASK